MKNDVVIIDRKDEFEYLPQATPAKAIATTSSDYLSLSAFHC